MKRVSILLLAGCVHRPVPTEGLYEVGNTQLSGERAVTTLLVLRVERLSAREAVIQTVDSEGEWEEHGRTHTFHASSQSLADPWPLRIQHAVAAAPARVHWDGGGALLSLVDAEAWRAEAWRAVEALGLPPAADISAQAVVDSQGLLYDLSRTFPGTPVPTWTRSGTIAGVDITLQETCNPSKMNGQTKWICKSEEYSAGTGEARLDGLRTWSTLIADRHGLVSLETGYEATLSLLDAGGVARLRAPVLGHRLVQRESKE